MTQREVLLLEEMIDAADQIQELVQGNDARDFEAHRIKRDALLWNFTVLGEASGQLSSAFKLAHSEVNWSRPLQLRNRIVHGYWSVDLDVLIATALNDLPDYVAGLQSVLSRLSAEQSS